VWTVGGREEHLALGGVGADQVLHAVPAALIAQERGAGELGTPLPSARARRDMASALTARGDTPGSSALLAGAS
jgi:hypothetical protein